MKTITWPELQSIHTIVFDFDGVFTDNKLYVNQEGIESVCCNRADGLGIDLLRSAINKGSLHAAAFILSKEANSVVVARAKKLKLECRHGVLQKKTWMDHYFSTNRPEDKEPYAGLIFLGNDLNDLALMEVAGFSVAPSDAHPLVKQVASVVLSERGGEGFVRAFIEHFLRINNMTIGEVNELISNC